MSGTSYPSFVDAPWADAYARLAKHCSTCVTCTAVDEEGVNLELPCATADQLNEEFRQARRARTAATFLAQDSADSRGAEIAAGPLDRPR
ncbi:hypothetical protein [Streptomyces afghaniensis]|uniref:hypothetical protein n=1 Tax=Streptomyces afghaniensis TaxID=66865 RepID=UPI00277FAB50|nr:hypothetical protein [Streptomyces afghaniensis]MDQ1018627.1 hypothetical protein [Streptomyces afghaniensis]